MGPYATVWAENWSEAIQEAPGSLWDASWPLQPLEIDKNLVFRGLGVQGAIPADSCSFDFKGCKHYF